MQPLLAVLAYHTGDAERTAELLKWIAELDPMGVRPHNCLLVYDDAVAKEVRIEIGRLAKESFDYVGNIPATIKNKWAPNGMFLSAAKWIRDCCKSPWLWLESDCVPLKEGWLNDLAEAYEECPKKFMGPLIRASQAGLPDVHLTGCSIYPPDAYDVYENLKPLYENIVAWDIEAAGVVVPRSKDTELLFHYWGMKDMPPVFVREKQRDDPKNFVTLNFLKPNAVLFHRNKDGSLIKLIREKKQLDVQK
jgi:hypothetical protein